MRRIDRILLAIHQAQPQHVVTRAALLAPHLDIEAFDVLALKRSGAGLGGGATAYSHVRVDGGSLHALVGGEAMELAPLHDADALDKAWTVRRGQPAELIAGTAERIGADLTLLAGSGKQRLPLWVRPARDAEVVRRCRGAVLLVRGAPQAVYRSVVVATDFSRASLAAASTAALLAPGARFVFVHALQLPEASMVRELDLPSAVLRACREQGWEAARRRLDAFVEMFLHALPAGRREVHAGLAHGVIRDCARRHGADLLVLGRGACHPGARLSCTNVMQRLMDEGGCDLLIGPDRAGDGDDRRLAA